MADLNTIFANLSQNFDADKAGDLDLTIAFNLSGDGGGHWYAKIADGKLDTGEGDVEGPSEGDLNPMMAFMSGKIKVDGDLNSVMKFQSVVGL